MQRREGDGRDGEGLDLCAEKRAGMKGPFTTVRGHLGLDYFGKAKTRSL